jgi:hypothetical protein
MKHSETVTNPISALRLDQLQLDGGTQPRVALDFDAVNDYQEAMVAGAKFTASGLRGRLDWNSSRPKSGRALCRMPSGGVIPSTIVMDFDEPPRTNNAR